jgi:hypothetical protein
MQVQNGLDLVTRLVFRLVTGGYSRYRIGSTTPLWAMLFFILGEVWAELVTVVTGSLECKPTLR